MRSSVLVTSSVVTSSRPHLIETGQAIQLVHSEVLQVLPNEGFPTFEQQAVWNCQQLCLDAAGLFRLFETYHTLHYI